MRRLSVFAAIAAFVPAAALAAALAPSTIVAAPSTYDGKTVTVTGKVANYQTSSTMMGTVAGYQLCDSKCVVVIDQKAGAQTNGATATVTGTFHATFKGPRKTYNNAILIAK